MEAWDTIRARRNVRSYLPDPISDGDLDRIAEAGWRAPSARNQQHWALIIVSDLGIGIGHSSVGDQEKARAILGVPVGYVVSFLLRIGYPADRPRKPIAKPDRRPFADVVHRGRW